MNLFSPLKIGPYELRNRIVMAPMTRNRAGDHGVPHPIMATYYQQRASAGLIITEATQISAQGVGYPHTPGIYDPDQVAGWKAVVEAVHERGGLIFVQLFHAGRISHPSLQEGGAVPVAPSGIRPAGEARTLEGPQPYVTPRALETDEISGIVAQYAHAATCALEAGFDGVELHGAHGYLPDQFLQDGTNTRTDHYGGSVENRARFLLEATDAVVDVWGKERVGVRLSPVSHFNGITDSDPDATFSYAAEALNTFDLAYLHVVEFDSANRDVVTKTLTTQARVLRAMFKGHYIGNGGFRRERAETALEALDVDMVSFGRAFISNPDLPERFARKAPLSPPDASTFYGGGEKGYTDYPALP
ncbi:MAG: alkene reductase [Thermodesulfobacteriota bacterium]